LTIKEFIIAAGFGLSDDAFHPPIRDLDIETFVGIWRVHGNVVLLPFLLCIRFYIDGRSSVM
jgi:hypothetical protein